MATGGEQSIFDKIYSEGTSRDALMYGKFFLPKFIEYRKMLFCEWNLEDDSDRKRIDTALFKNSGDLQKTEKEFNYIEIEYLFSKSDGLLNDNGYKELANIMTTLWKHSASLQFPQWQVVFEVVGISTNSPDEIGIVFYVNR
jgi:hypothetical protein